MDHDGLLPGVGTTLVGKYRLERKLGQGGMGAVYEATHLRLGQRVAIKIVLPEVARRPELASRFEHEARAAARLRSRHTARVFDVDTSPEGLRYLVMEYLEGHCLRDELKRRGPLPVAEAVRYVREACEGVDEAHRAGIIHRDLKPANLFLSIEGQERIVKVIDFGIAKMSDAGNVDYRTATNAPLGTYAFMSPEQANSARSADVRSDVWSLGVVLYQLLSGKLPFQGEGVMGLFYAIATQAPPPLRAVRPDVPEALVAVIERALCKEPGGRFQVVRELSDALAPFDCASASRAPAGPRAPTVDRSPHPQARPWVEPGDLALLSTFLAERDAPPSAPAPAPGRGSSSDEEPGRDRAASNSEVSGDGATTGAKSYAKPIRPMAPSTGAPSRTLWLVGAVVALFAAGVTAGIRAASPGSGTADFVSGATSEQSSGAGVPVRAKAPLADKDGPAEPTPSLRVVGGEAMQESERAPASREPTPTPPVVNERPAKTPGMTSGSPAGAHAGRRAPQGQAIGGKPARSVAPEPQEANEQPDIEKFLGTAACATRAFDGGSWRPRSRSPLAS